MIDTIHPWVATGWSTEVNVTMPRERFTRRHDAQTERRGGEAGHTSENRHGLHLTERHEIPLRNPRSAPASGLVAVGSTGAAVVRGGGRAGEQRDIAGIDIPAERGMFPENDEGHGRRYPPAAQPASLKQAVVVRFSDPEQARGHFPPARLKTRNRPCRFKGQEFPVLESDPVGRDVDR